MPIIFEKQIDAAKKLAVWHITEQVEELYAICEYLPLEMLSAKRNIEIAVSRCLINYLVEPNSALFLLKDENGKPFLSNSDISISFSHSKQMVACIINTEGANVGIDIEEKRERIKIIAPKFVTPNDITGCEENKHFHIVWGAKEVLYKIYAKKLLDFKDHMQVEFNTEKGIGTIFKNEYLSTHHLEYVELGNYMLVWGG